MDSSTSLVRGRFSRYFKDSSSVYYGVVMAIPMLVAYEALLFIGGNPRFGQVRNAGDVWMRHLLGSLEINQAHAALVMLLGLVIAMVLLRRDGVRIKAKFLGFMTVETVFYSVLLGVFSSVYSAILTFMLDDLSSVRLAIAAASPLSGGVAQNIALSLGAGLFEEFIFRVVLLWVLLLVLRPVLPGYLASAAAIGVAAGLFSAAHYIGPMAYTFDLYSFMFRFLAGIWFTGLYYMRGFTVTAYSHAFYDINVILF